MEALAGQLSFFSLPARTYFEEPSKPYKFDESGDRSIKTSFLIWAFDLLFSSDMKIALTKCNSQLS